MGGGCLNLRRNVQWGYELQSAWIETPPPRNKALITIRA